MKAFLLTFISIASLILCSGAMNLDRVKQSKPDSFKEVVCFVYHRFGDTRYPSTNISAADFEAHLLWLKKNGYVVMSLSDAVTYVKSPGPSKKVAVLTIDDGYKSFYTNGLPLLKKYNMPATLFINTETVGSPDFMDWDELKNVANSKIEIGNHTHSHAYFLNLNEAERYDKFRKELEQCQRLIREHLDVIPKVFSYPYGEFDKRMKSIVEEFGFIAAAAQNSGVLHTGSDFFQIPRFPMSEAFAGINNFEEKARMHALHLSEEKPETFLLDNPRPLLTLTFSADDLDMRRLQCFVQGDSCLVKIVRQTDTDITLTLQSASPLHSRRRTLYTLTIPDAAGAWHWYSHLWINPAIK